jgi:hypothetical protein
VAAIVVSASFAAAAPALAADETAIATSGSDPVVQGRVVTQLDGTTSEVPTSGSTESTTGGCWYAQASRWIKNIFGVRLATYYQKISWCASNGYLTSHSRTRWGTTSFPGWSWEGNINSTQDGGNGWTGYRSFTQGHFCYIKYVSCAQNWYPWIDMTVYANGTYAWKTGG